MHRQTVGDIKRCICGHIGFSHDKEGFCVYEPPYPLLSECKCCGYVEDTPENAMLKWQLYGILPKE